MRSTFGIVADDGLLCWRRRSRRKRRSAAEFYRGKRLTLITSASVGGGYDQYARPSRSTCRASSRETRRSWCRTWSARKAFGPRTSSTTWRRRTGPSSGASPQQRAGKVLRHQQRPSAVRRTPVSLAGLATAGIGLFVLRTQKGAKTIADLKKSMSSSHRPRARSDLDLSAHAQCALRRQDQGRRWLRRPQESAACGRTQRGRWACIRRLLGDFRARSRRGSRAMPTSSCRWA